MPPAPFEWTWGSRSQGTPVVELTVGGRTRHANLFADLPFGEAGGPVSEMWEGDEPEEVEVSLSAATPGDREESIELVAGEWSLPELLGRQLLVRTTPLVEPHENPTARIGDLDVFTPSLSLQGVDLEREEATEASAFGDPFSLRGDRLSATESGIVSRNGEPFVTEDAGDPEAVAEPSATADPVEYPTIRLSVTTTDDDGEPVSGLPASAFETEGEDTEVLATMTENTARPHVLLVRDVSGSMPGSYGDIHGEEWFVDLRAVIGDEVPETDLEYREVDSAMWTHLTEAVANAPDLVIYAHDGRETDEYVPAMEAVLAGAPPTILLSAYDDEEPVADETVLEQADLTGAETAPMGDFESVKATVRRHSPTSRARPTASSTTFPTRTEAPARRELGSLLRRARSRQRRRRARRGRPRRGRPKRDPRRGDDIVRGRRRPVLGRRRRHPRGPPIGRGNGRRGRRGERSGSPGGDRGGRDSDSP